MLKLMIQDLDCPIEIEDWEINQSGPSYTYDTIQHVQENYPDTNLSMVLGADQLIKFPRWKNYKEIIKRRKFFYKIFFLQVTAAVSPSSELVGSVDSMAKQLFAAR